MSFRLPWPTVTDERQQKNNEALLAALNEFRLFWSHGQGAPSHTPAGPQIYFEEDGPGVHVYNGGWVAL